jgi:hypothetical protein
MLRVPLAIRTRSSLSVAPGCRPASRCRCVVPLGRFRSSPKAQHIIEEGCGPQVSGRRISSVVQRKPWARAAAATSTSWLALRWRQGWQRGRHQRAAYRETEAPTPNEAPAFEHRLDVLWNASRPKPDIASCPRRATTHALRQASRCRRSG